MKICIQKWKKGKNLKERKFSAAYVAASFNCFRIIFLRNENCHDFHAKGVGFHASVTEAELERLKHALKLLSEAEKQLRVSSERSTWFTAALLQLGSMPSLDFTHSGSSRRQSCRSTEDDRSSATRDTTAYKHKSDAQYASQKPTSPASLRKAVNVNPNHLGELLSRVNDLSSNSKLSESQSLDEGALVAACNDVSVSGKLDDVWAHCIERCHSKTLRQLLDSHGKLVSISEVEG